MTAPGQPDFQRASALITHRARGDMEAIRFVFREADSEGRLSQLLRAVLETFSLLAGELRTPDAWPLIDNLLTDWAGRHENAMMRSAAAGVVAYRTGDSDGVNAAIVEANELGGTGLFVGAVVDVYGACFPELAAPLGVKLFAEFTARIAGEPS